jgi:uncharacterized protein
LVVRAKPGARIAGIACDGDTVTVSVRAKAVDGDANAAITLAIAAWLDVAPSNVTIERGATSRVKRLAIRNVSEQQLAGAVARLVGAS